MYDRHDHRTNSERVFMRFIMATLFFSTVLFMSCGIEQPPPAPAPVTGHSTMVRLDLIDGPAGNLCMEDGGQGGIPVLFVHGLSGEMVVWDAQLRHLRASRRAIALDLRDHGLSDAPSDGDYSLDALASDVHAVVTELELPRVILAGHSMGGAVITRYAALHPDRVAGLLYVDSVGDLTQIPEERLSAFKKQLKNGQPEEVVRGFFTDLLANAKPETQEVVWPGVDNLPPRVIYTLLDILLNYSPVEDLASSHCPKLSIIADGNDEPFSLHNVGEGIPHHLIEGTSHWVMMEKPAEFNRVMDEFLAGIQD